MKFNLILAAALVAGGLTAEATTQPAAAGGTNASPEAAMTALFGNPAVVKGKGFEIKRNDLDQVVSGARANAAAAGQQLPPDFQASVLEQLITIQVLLQTANPADQAAGRAEADLQYTNLLKKFVSSEAFERQLKAVGMTVDELRAKATQEATAKTALKRELHISITDEDAKDYYNQHPADFEQPELAHARHILLATVDLSTRPPTPLSTNTVAAKRRQAEDLIKQIRGGANFADLAKKFSEDTGSKENGGELPQFPRGQMVPEFESAAFAMTNSQVSDIVTSQYGFHIIQLIDKTPAKKVDFGTAAPDIKDGLARLKIAKLAPDFVKKLRVEQNVEILDADLKAMDERVQAAQAAQAAAAAEAAPASTNK